VLIVLDYQLKIQLLQFMLVVVHQMLLKPPLMEQL